MSSIGAITAQRERSGEEPRVPPNLGSRPAACVPLCGLGGCPDAVEDVHDLRDLAFTE